MPVVGTAFLLTVDRALGGVHIEHDALGLVLRFGLSELTRGSSP